MATLVTVKLSKAELKEYVCQQSMTVFSRADISYSQYPLGQISYSQYPLGQICYSQYPLGQIYLMLKGRCMYEAKIYSLAMNIDHAPCSPHHSIRSFSNVRQTRVARADGKRLSADKLRRGLAYSNGHTQLASSLG